MPQLATEPLIFCLPALTLCWCKWLNKAWGCWPEESSGGVRSSKPEHIRNGANPELLCLALETALLQPGQRQGAAAIPISVGGWQVSSSTFHMCLWREAGKERDISAHPSGHRIKTCICTGEWKGAHGTFCLLLAKRNKIVVAVL